MILFEIKYFEEISNVILGNFFPRFGENPVLPVIEKKKKKKRKKEKGRKKSETQDFCSTYLLYEGVLDFFQFTLQLQFHFHIISRRTIQIMYLIQNNHI